MRPPDPCRVACALALALAWLAPAAAAQEPAPGWAARYPPPAASGGSVLERWPAPHFALQSGESSHPAVAPSDLAVRLQTRLQLDAPGRYRFALDVQGGSATLSVREPGGGAGAEVIAPPPNGSAGGGDWLELKGPEALLTLEYQRHGNAPTRLRVLWEMAPGETAGFLLEPIPARFTRVPDAGAGAPAAGDAGRRGRVLLGELGCVNCHAPGKNAPAAVSARPGPYLRDVARRADGAWLQRYIAGPQELVPAAAMPDLFGDSPAELEDARAVAAYLQEQAFLGAPRPYAAPEATPASLVFGRQLYHEAGCVACHGPLQAPAVAYGDEALPAELPQPAVARPFGDLRGKWRGGELAEYLRNPLAVDPSGRMPACNLAENEAGWIAAYLLAQWGAAAAPPGPRPDRALLERGREQFAARGCADCHQLGSDSAEASRLQAPPLAALRSGGCLDGAPGAPRYALSEQDRAALRRGIGEANAALGHPAPPDAARRSLAALRCDACHARDGAGGLDPSLRPYFRATVGADIGDEGRIPPDLSGAGFKLSSSWLRTVLTGSGRARPHMAARMPQFGAPAVEALVAQLAQADGTAPDSDLEAPAAAAELVAAGRQLAGVRGFDCTSCHAFRDFHSSGAPAMEHFTTRLRYEWWSLYVHDPARFKPGTRMPRYFEKGGSVLTRVLGGDAHAQADALWAYFAQGESMAPPEGAGAGGNFLLRPQDRPLVLRTFLREAGTRAVAVAFPGGWNFAFDAQRCRLAYAWRGDFLDASSSWTNRGGSFAQPAGTLVWRAPDIAYVLMRLGGAPEPAEAASQVSSRRFRGYSLDAAGVPTFQLSFQAYGTEVLASERFLPARNGFQHCVRLEGLPPETRVLPDPGLPDVRITETPDSRDAVELLWSVTP